MKIIVINREYYAGGHSVAKLVAENLGVEIYDKDIIKHTAASRGIDIGQVEREEESLSRMESFLRAITPISYDEKDSLFETESEIILELASQGPCVIIGRCADFILKKAGYDVLSVFLYADHATRRKRYLNVTGKSISEREMKSVDYSRKSYNEFYTGREWHDTENYDLMLDTGSLGYELSAKLILEAAKEEKK